MKKFYKENRVFVILMGVALLCIAVIVAMLTSYVLRSTRGNTYGNRLDGIDDVKIEETDKNDMEAKVLEMAKVEDVKINIHGKIVNFNVDMAVDATVAEAQNVGVACAMLFEDDYLNFYDLQFIMTKSNSEESTSTFPMLGYRKAGASTITWSNNAK